MHKTASPPRRLRLRLRPVLDGLRITESELARRLGFSRQHVSDLLSREDERARGGKGRGVSLSTVDRLGLALDVDPLVLLEVVAEDKNKDRRSH